MFSIRKSRRSVNLKIISKSRDASLDNPTIKNFSMQSQEESLLTIFNKNKVPLNQSCGGNATCGTCKVLVSCKDTFGIHLGLDKELQQRSDIESEFCNERPLEQNERLACQFNCLFLEDEKFKNLKQEIEIEIEIPTLKI